VGPRGDPEYRLRSVPPASANAEEACATDETGANAWVYLRTCLEKNHPGFETISLRCQAQIDADKAHPLLLSPQPPATGHHNKLPLPSAIGSQRLAR
jgi:hypothetical protein